MTLFSWVHKDIYKKLFACLPDPNAMRFVGGAVRNTLLGIPFDDVDFATSYRPQEITAFFNAKGCKVIPTGIEHGTVTVLCDGASYEITTLRRDVETDGRHAVIAYTPVWQEDALRRDFTMNALYVDHLGTVHDDVGGQADIAQGLIRFIGDPSQRIQEDYLRILRFFRFWALYGWHADPASFQACCQLKDHLSQLSSERITKEVLKMLSAQRPWLILTLMKEHRFEALVWGMCTQPGAIEALAQLEQHWGGAPLWVRVAFLTGAMPKRLTLSKEQKKHMLALWSPFGVGDIWASVYAYGVAVTQEKIWMLALHFVRDHWKKKAGGAEFSSAILAWLDARKKERDALNHQVFPEFYLSGQDVLCFGISGPEVGRVLKETKAWWIQQYGAPSREDCLAHAEKMARP